MRLTSRWTVVEGHRVHALAGGPSRAAGGLRPVVVVHGLGAASAAQAPFARVLAARWPVYAPDLPGFGSSEAPPGGVLGIDGLADRLAAWAVAEGLPPAAFVGNSAGCQVLAALAQRHPQRVDRLVLQGPTVDPQARTAARQVARFALDGFVERPSLGPLQARAVWRAGPARLLATFRAVLADRIEERLPALDCPVMVVRGSRDPIVPGGWAAEAARLAPRGCLTVVPRAPHCMVFSAPAALAAVTVPFLAEAPSG